MKRYNISAWGDGDFGLDVDEYETGEWVRFDDVSAALARAEAAEGLIAFMYRSSVIFEPRIGCFSFIKEFPPPYNFARVHVDVDGTDAGILAALLRAIEGEK